MKPPIHLAKVMALAVIMCFNSFALPAGVDQPYMEKAKDNLQSARNFLNKATADKGGHRNKALNQVNQAINAVNNGIEYDRTHRSSQPLGDLSLATGSSSSADQANMQAAKDELQKAIENLNRASADKGGWRNKALAYARNAIEQVNAGMAFDRRN